MLEIFLSPVAWLGALGIFALRVIDMTCDTLRMLFVVRGRKGIAWALGFVQSFIFVIAITTVLKQLDNPLNIIGYAAGFATGNVVGMLIEGRLAVGHVKVSIVTQHLGTAVCQVLRDSGFGVTEIPARGRDGMVSMLSVSVLRKDVSKVEDIVHATDAGAFIISEDVRPLQRGFWRA
jgi:uncharacterized protein YebE (UPF0316 family)